MPTNQSVAPIIRPQVRRKYEVLLRATQVSVGYSEEYCPPSGFQ